MSSQKWIPKTSCIILCFRFWWNWWRRESMLTLKPLISTVCNDLSTFHKLLLDHLTPWVFSSSEFFLEVFLVFLKGLGWLRGSSMVVCEALCDIACKKGYTNKFRFDLRALTGREKQDSLTGRCMMWGSYLRPDRATLATCSGLRWLYSYTLRHQLGSWKHIACYNCFAFCLCAFFSYLRAMCRGMSL